MTTYEQLKHLNPTPGESIKKDISKIFEKIKNTPSKDRKTAQISWMKAMLIDCLEELKTIESRL